MQMTTTTAPAPAPAAGGSMMIERPGRGPATLLHSRCVMARILLGCVLFAVGLPMGVFFIAIVVTPVPNSRDDIPWFRVIMALMMVLPVVLTWGGVWMVRAGRASLIEVRQTARWRQRR